MARLPRRTRWKIDFLRRACRSGEDLSAGGILHNHGNRHKSGDGDANKQHDNDRIEPVPAFPSVRTRKQQFCETV
jgi:hypothetical protein